jgi:hypothetical protein
MKLSVDMSDFPDETQWEIISKSTGRRYELTDPNNAERRVLECLIGASPNHIGIDDITEMLGGHGTRTTRIRDWIGYIDCITDPDITKKCYLYRLNKRWSQLL